MKKDRFKFIKIFVFSYSTGEAKFSTKKCYAFLFSMIGVFDQIMLRLFDKHWSITLTNSGVDSSVIIAIEASLAALIVGALGIYGWSKAKGGE